MRASVALVCSITHRTRRKLRVDKLVNMRQFTESRATIAMQDINYSAADIREALRYVDASDIPDRHKRVLLDVVAQALKNADSGVPIDSQRSVSGTWQQHEVQTVAAHLEGKVAVNWQHADELVMWLVACLRRGPGDIKKKAIELGFGAGVDYRIAKSMPTLDEA